MKQVYQTSRSERFTYGLYFVGQLFVYTLISFVQIFFTDIGIPAAIVGMIFMVAKVWDAVNDPLFGIIVDRSHPKKGKFKPWIKLSSFLIPAATVFLFAIPQGVSTQIKTIWAVAGYLIWDTVYTMSDVPIYALSTAMTTDIPERNKLLYIAKLLGFIALIPVAIAVPLIYPTIGWFQTVLIVSICALPAMIPIGFIAKERASTTSEETVSAKRLVTYLFKNKFLMIYVLVIIVMSLTGFSGTVRGYVALHCLGGSEWMSVLSLTYVFPLILGPFIYPLLNKLMDRGRLFGITGLSLSAFGIAQYFVGYSNIAGFLILDVIKGIGTGIIAVGLTMSIADCVVYGTFKTGERAEAVTFSIQTFSAKIQSALSGAIGMLVLGAIGFIEGQGVIQSQSVIDSLFFMYCISGVFSSVPAFILWLVMFKLKDKDVDIMAKCNNGELGREEAEAALSRKY